MTYPPYEYHHVVLSMSHYSATGTGRPPDPGHDLTTRQWQSSQYSCYRAAHVSIPIMNFSVTYLQHCIAIILQLDLPCIVLI